MQGPHLAGRAINEIEKNRAAAAKVKYVNSLKVTSHPLQAGPSTDTKPIKAPIADRREAGDWGEKSPLPGSRYNRIDDTVDPTETDSLDAVPLVGRCKENVGEGAGQRRVYA
ncbi:hypothetical protein ABZ612_31125 [Streptomyces avermitilis]|uniref:hypothetical protein n=1 Tax=Streptomyces avermitilis TaxID=33903 RepID=UPI0033DCD9E0